MRRKVIKVVGDALVYGLALIFAYWIRFDGPPPPFEFRQMTLWLPAVIAISLLCNRALGVYRRIWRYVCLHDCFVLALSAGVMSATLTVLRILLTPDYQLLRPALGVIAADYMLAVVGTTGLRIVTRIYYEYREGRHIVVSGYEADSHVLLAGAGMAGILVANEIRSSRKLRWNVIGFVDDDPAKLGTVIHGLKVLGTTKDIPTLVAEHKVDKVVVSIARASSRQIRRIVEICDSIPVRTQIIPGFFELLEGKEEISKIRDVRIDDLLGRDEVRPTQTASEMSLYFRNKVILVTGAGGSIGGELCRQLAALSPRILVILDKDENSIFETVLDLRRHFPYVTVKPFIGDLRNDARLHAIFADVRPEVVFHAAAHKHVPLMEENLREAVENNVFGTVNLIQCCEEFSVGRFVMLSSDKAVKCINVIGACKRLTELYIQRQAQSSRIKYSCVRFGNVLGSKGSVVPLFQKQIEDGGPVTVTHPEATRYFMTIPEASQLVIQAASLGEKGEVFILEMGKPVRIFELARDVIHLSGLKDEEIDIKFIGLRPGEKLHEEVVHEKEILRKTKYDKIMVADPLEMDLSGLDAALANLRNLMHSGSEAELRDGLFAITRAPEPSVGRG